MLGPLPSRDSDANRDYGPSYSYDGRDYDYDDYQTVGSYPSRGFDYYADFPLYSDSSFASDASSTPRFAKANFQDRSAPLFKSAGVAAE